MAAIAEIHTSDRNLFKRCRRRWDIQSPVRRNLVSRLEEPLALWFGSGWHFALEDYYGYNHYGEPQEALKAYLEAYQIGRLPLPDGAKEQIEVGIQMLDNYLDWLYESDFDEEHGFKTVWIDGKPQVEVQSLIPIPKLGVEYSVTIDRVMEDKHGRWWICDYKTARTIDTGKLETDPQITTYLLFAEHILEHPIEGMVYMQFRKAAPHQPKVLKDGSLSMAKNQDVTHAAYLKALLSMYGEIPVKYVGFLKHLAQNEVRDKFIRVDLVRRNAAFRAAEYQKIVQEVGEMLDPNLNLYPNPTRDCIWDCPARQVCLAMDDGSDWEQLLDLTFTTRPEKPAWRKFLRSR